MSKFRQALEKVNPFNRDGRLKTEYQKATEAASRFDDRGRLKGPVFEKTLDQVSEVDRESGLPK